MYIKLLFFTIVVSVVMCHPCAFKNSIDISNGTRDDKGVITYDIYKFDRNEYFIDNETGTERGCVCLKRNCLRKCCADGFAYEKTNKVCVEEKTGFSPPVYDRFFALADYKLSDLFLMFYGKPECLEDEFIVTLTELSDDFHLVKDGHLWVKIAYRNPPFEYHTPDKYCIDTFVQEENGVKKTQLNALVCFKEDEEDNHYIVNIACMYLSCFFILLTLAVYAWLPELRNLHGKVLMGYLGSFFCAFVLLATFQLIIVINSELLVNDVCLFFTVVIYFFLQAAFFWMNVMCFDIYWTICGKRGMSLERVSTNARFLKYALYAFGCSLALTLLLIILEYSGLSYSPYLPNLTKNGCFLYGESKLIYLYGPITVLLVANLVFFVLTSVEIYRFNRGTKPFLYKGNDSSMHDKTRTDRNRFLLYVKLFCVMGISWILEVISSRYPELNIIWIYTDAYNVLLGVIIFIISVCKKNIFSLMRKRYRQTRGEFDVSRMQSSSSRTLDSREEIRLSITKS